MYAGLTLRVEELPIRLCARSTCFRREAGAAGRETRGLIRQHQFEKLEMVSLVREEEGEAEHERMIQIQSRLLHGLGIPLRALQIRANELGLSAARKVDLEAWMPGSGEWRELTSASWCTDFQAARLGIKLEDGSRPHTLNATALALGRTMAALVENAQSEDGSVILPAFLQEWGAPQRIHQIGE